jgi:hypothetical protein
MHVPEYARHGHTCVCTCVRMYSCMHACMYIHRNVCVYAHVYGLVKSKNKQYMYALYLCMYEYECVHLYVCHKYTHTQTQIHANTVTNTSTFRDRDRDCGTHTTHTHDLLQCVRRPMMRVRGLEPGADLCVRMWSRRIHWLPPCVETPCVVDGACTHVCMHVCMYVPESWLCALDMMKHARAQYM